MRIATGILNRSNLDRIVRLAASLHQAPAAFVVAGGKVLAACGVEPEAALASLEASAGERNGRAPLLRAPIIDAAGNCTGELCVVAPSQVPHLESVFGELAALAAPDVALHGSFGLDHLRAAFEHAATPVTVCRSGVHVYANQAYARLFGCDTASEIVGRPVSDLIAPAERARVTGILQARDAGQPSPEAYETIALSKPGEEVRVEVHASTYDIAGSPHTVAFLYDVTERKRAELEFRETSERLRAVIQASPLPIVAFDTAGTVELWNRAAERTFGWSAAEVLGGPLPFLPKEDLESHNMIRSISMAGIGLSNVEVQRRRKDGAVADLSVSTAPMRDAEGNVTGVMAVYLDVTEQKQIENRLRQAQKMEAIGRLAGGIAHDFNSLLTIILGYTQMLADALESNDEFRETTAEIQSAAERAAQLTKQLLAFSRHQAVDTRSLSLLDVVGAMENLLRRAVGEHIEFRTSLDERTPLVDANFTQMEQVVLNLVLNARDAMPVGGRLLLEIKGVPASEIPCTGEEPLEPERFVMLAVHDEGTGMDPETRTRMFEPFFSTKEQGKGTGLGLATVYGIVKQHGGHISVESDRGKGTSFRVFLPAVTATESGDPATPDIRPSRGDETVLLAEDEPALRRLVKGMLEGDGYHVIEAGTVEEAIKLSEEDSVQFDLLLTDVVMPGMSGPDLARTIGFRRTGVQVVFMSGYVDEQHSHGVLQPGSRFLQKPFSRSTLLRTVRTALDGRRREPR